MNSVNEHKSSYSEAFLRQQTAILDDMDEFVWSIDRNNCIVEYNPAFYNRYSKLIGSSEIKGAPFFNPKLGDFINTTYARYFRTVIDTGERQIFRDKNESPHTGMSSYSEVRIYPLYNEGKIIDGFLIKARDLTEAYAVQLELKAVNEELVRNMELYRTLASQIPNFGVVIFDKDYRFLLCEGTALATVGLSKEQYEGRTMFEAMEEHEVKALKPKYDAALKGNFINFEYSARGREYYTQILPVKAKDGEVVRGMVIVNDITDLKQAEHVLADTNRVLEKEVVSRTKQLENTNQELREINQYLDDFVHAAAHDLRSPIVNLKTILRLMNTIENEKERHALIGKIPELVDSIGNTLDGMIRMVEYQKKNQMLVATLGLNKIFANAIKVFEDRIHEIGALVSADFSEVDTIDYIEPKLQSIFYNLISNSLKYANMQIVPQVYVTARLVDGYVRLDFWDNGIGIDIEKHKDNLFKPFKRFAGESITGTGLGLSLVKSIVEKNGGFIEVDSKRGEYTLFRVWLKPYKDN